MFVKGLPLGMVGTRLAVLAIVAIIVTLGLAPITIETARPGIIACVLCLFALAMLDFYLETRALETGRANEIDSLEQSNR